MSDSLVVKNNASQGAGYTVKKIEGCRVIFGVFPISEFAMLIHGFSNEAVVNNELADLMGATFVIGEPADIQRLVESNLLPSEQKQMDAEQAKSVYLTEQDFIGLKIHSYKDYIYQSASQLRHDAINANIDPDPESQAFKIFVYQQYILYQEAHLAIGNSTIAS